MKDLPSPLCVTGLYFGFTSAFLESFKLRSPRSQSVCYAIPDLSCSISKSLVCLRSNPICFKCTYILPCWQSDSTLSTKVAKSVISYSKVSPSLSDANDKVNSGGSLWVKVRRDILGDEKSFVLMLTIEFIWTPLTG